MLIEEPYCHTSLGWIENSRLLNDRTCHITWIDENGNEHETQFSNEEADKWIGYALLFEFCDEEILVLK